MHIPAPPALSCHKNKTGTSSIVLVKSVAGSGHDATIEARCAFVAGDAGGRASPFCDAPALPGSAYCAAHRARCEVAPGSAESLRLARDLDREAEAAAPPPEELRFLASIELPEPDTAEEPEDWAACLDGLPKPHRPDFE